MGYPKLEYKYLFPASIWSTLRTRISRMSELDPYAARTEAGEYTIRSVYFDTRRFDAYEEKIEGVRVRRKFRVRVYGERTPESVAFLEIKRKDGVLLTKYRAPVLFDNLGVLFETHDIDRYVRKNGGVGVDREFARRWLYHYYSRDLRPVVLVTYERVPFVCTDNPDLRITLDSNLRTRLATSLVNMHEDGDMLTPAMRGFGTLEVKFTRGVPRWLRDVIHEFGLKRMALSKYTISLDALRHGLPFTGRSFTRLDARERVARHYRSLTPIS
jgi:hypothetical protein